MNLIRTNETIENDIITALNSYQQIVIWGSGGLGQIAYSKLCEWHLHEKVVAFADSDSSKWGTSFNEISIQSYAYIKAHYKRPIFIICSLWWQAISSQLKDLNADFYIWPFLYLNTSCTSDHIHNWPTHLTSTVEEQIDSVFSLLEDDKSKKVFSTLIEIRKTGDIQLLNDILFDNIQYFDKDVWHFSNDEILLDVGAFTGDTILEFLKFTDYKYKKIIAMEANSETFNILKNTISQNNIKDVELYNLGALDKACEVNFSNEEGRSTISDNGSQIIKMDTLDSLFMDTPITLIKMDIEGAEQQALIGAKNLIQKYKPKLAICIYHKTEDLYKIPLMIKEILPEYKLQMRHYGCTLDETVIYAYL